MLFTSSSIYNMSNLLTLIVSCQDFCTFGNKICFSRFISNTNSTFGIAFPHFVIINRKILPQYQFCHTRVAIVVIWSWSMKMMMTKFWQNHKGDYLMMLLFELYCYVCVIALLMSVRTTFVVAFKFRQLLLWLPVYLLIKKQLRWQGYDKLITGDVIVQIFQANKNKQHSNSKNL